MNELSKALIDEVKKESSAVQASSRSSKTLTVGVQLLTRGSVPLDELCQLWPGDGRKAKHSLASSLTYLRQGFMRGLELPIEIDRAAGTVRCLLSQTVRDKVCNALGL